LNLFIYLFILKGTTYFATLLDCINRQAIQILFFIKGTFLIIKTAPHILFTLRSCKFPNKILADFPPNSRWKSSEFPTPIAWGPSSDSIVRWPQLKCLSLVTARKYLYFSFVCTLTHSPGHLVHRYHHTHSRRTERKSKCYYPA